MLRSTTHVLAILLYAVSSFATVTINAQLFDAQGHPVQYSFLKLQLDYCGYNIPQVPGGTFSIVQKQLTFTPAQLPATIYGNNEITCGNSYSTLWHVTAYMDDATPIAGDYDYDICSSTTNCANGIATTAWNLASAQPFVIIPGSPPAPGFQTIFGNPTQNQVISQPAGTSLSINGLINFLGATAENCTFCGGGGGGGSASGPLNALQFAVNGTSGFGFGGSSNLAWDNATSQLSVGQAGGAVQGITTPILNNVQYVDARLIRGGIDVGDEINKTYAACPSYGCIVKPAPGAYSFSTPIVATAASKPLVILCDYGANSVQGPTTLTYTATTGTAITLATGAGSGIFGCNLRGPNIAGTAKGLSLSNTIGGSQTQSIIFGASITNFGTCVTLGNNAYLIDFSGDSFTCTKTFSVPAGITGSGERIGIHSSLLQGAVGGTYSATCFDIESNTETLAVYDTSFDSCGITINANGNYLFSGGNLENENTNTTLDFFTIGSACGQCAVTIEAINTQEDFAAARSHLITNGAAGARLNINGGHFNPGTTMAELVNSVSGSSTVITQPFFSLPPTVPIGGNGAAISMMDGIVGVSSYFTTQGVVYEGGAGVPAGSCIGSVTFYMRNDAPDQLHEMYECYGGTWYRVTGVTNP